MKKTITAKQAAFLLPLFLLLAVFAIYPIVTSVVYSLFDYRTNDQTAAGLYTGSNFNAPLFYEDCDYVTWYLEDEVTVLPAADAAEMQGIIDEVNALAAPYENAKEVVSINDSDAQTLLAEISDIRTRLEDILNETPMLRSLTAWRPRKHFLMRWTAASYLATSRDLPRMDSFSTIPALATRFPAPCSLPRYPCSLNWYWAWLLR